MKGTSAYCGVLQIAALQVAIQIADILEKKEDARQLRIILKKDKDSISNKLWNGKYYNFDQKSDDIFVAQLMGQWYLDQLHLPAVIMTTLIQDRDFRFPKFSTKPENLSPNATLRRSLSIIPISSQLPMESPIHNTSSWKKS